MSWSFLSSEEKIESKKQNVDLLHKKQNKIVLFCVFAQIKKIIFLGEFWLLKNFKKNTSLRFLRLQKHLLFELRKCMISHRFFSFAFVIFVGNFINFHHYLSSLSLLIVFKTSFIIIFISKRKLLTKNTHILTYCTFLSDAKLLRWDQISVWINFAQLWSCLCSDMICILCKLLCYMTHIQIHWQIKDTWHKQLLRITAFPHFFH